MSLTPPFIVLLLLVIVLTVIALGSPWWLKVSDKDAFLGLFKQCWEPNDHGLCINISSHAMSISGSLNVDYIKTLQKHEQATIGLLILGLGFELVTLAWFIYVCSMFCCQECLSKPLIILTCLGTVCLLAAEIVYGVKAETDRSSGSTTMHLSYSFWVGCAALVTMTVITLLSFCIACTHKIEPEDY